MKPEPPLALSYWYGVTIENVKVFKLTQKILCISNHGVRWFILQVGNFPLNFVEPVEIPQTEPEEKLFYALEDFPAEMSGDLPFKRGMAEKTFKV